MAANFSYSKLRDKLQKLSLREQVLLLVGAVAITYFLVDALVFTPQALREQVLLDKHTAMQSQMAVLSVEIAAIDKAQRADNLAEKQTELLRLQKQAALLDSVVQSVATDTPKLRALAAGMLGSKTAAVNAVSLKTLAVKPLLSQAKSQAQSAGNGVASVSAGSVYKHGLDVELRGSYLDLMAFVANVEAAHPKLWWSDATLKAGKYPETTLSVSVFFLSTRPRL